MHVVFFGDQHVESLGGAQVSMRLQRRQLEAAGHTVTVVAPRSWSKRIAHKASSTVDLPSLPMTGDREYSMSWPGPRVDRFVDRAMAQHPPVDLVHIQADFWGASIGHRFAHRHGLPVVHTMHNRVEVGVAALTPFYRPALALMISMARRFMRGIGERIPGFAPETYLRVIAQGSDAVTAPSSHFARRLEHTQVFSPVDVVWNGIDDQLLDQTLAQRSTERAPRPRFVWIGRMSPEKRLLPFLEAVVASGIDADIEVIGSGQDRRAAEKLARHHPGIRFVGRLSYPDTLSRIAAADAVVQTSLGFETQGMTPFEAAALGTPTLVCDPNIAAELRGGFWQTPDGSVAGLAHTLRQATADIVAGTAPVSDPTVAADFRQSSRTAAMLAVYERVLAAHKR